MKLVFALLALACLAAGGATYYAKYVAAVPTASFRTVPIKRGDLLSTISATGTVEAEEFVDVGTQVVGRIKSLGIDPSDPEKKKTIDYLSVVHVDTVLALIDDAIYKAQVNQAQASLERSKADLLQLQAHCDEAEHDWKRADSLRATNAIADTDYDLAVATYKAAKANVAVGQATIQQSEAALELAKTNLDYTVIRSPVEGTIVDRRVNVGQTVVSSLNAPSLFLIAKDLRRIQVWASVNEADIGRIHAGIPVRFTVDAYPGAIFRGKVAQVRLNATMTQNVVTYTVVVVTDNSDEKLLPYMTANLQFEIEQRPDVLLVPNTALRWKPQPDQIAPQTQEATSLAPAAPKEGGKEEHARTKPGGDPAIAKAPKGAEDRGRLWVDGGGFVRPLTVQVGTSDGVMTEVSGKGVQEGIEVVIGEKRKDDHSSPGDMTNPFVPQLRGGGKPKTP